MTISGHTVIHTLRGDVFASDLVGRKDPTPVFTWDGERVTVGHVIVEGPVVQVPLRIALDDGSELFVADGGRVILRDLNTSYVRDLENGASLLPLYLKPDSHGYPKYKEPGDWNKGAQTKADSYNWRRVARMAAEWKLARRCRPGDIVRHRDGNRRNCEPDNLFIDYREPKMSKQKAGFAEPIFEAQRIIGKLNHKIDDLVLDFSREMFFLRGKELTVNVAVSGIFVLTDTE